MHFKSILNHITFGAQPLLKIKLRSNYSENNLKENESK